MSTAEEFLDPIHKHTSLQLINWRHVHIYKSVCKILKADKSLLCEHTHSPYGWQLETFFHCDVIKEYHSEVGVNRNKSVALCVSNL